MSLRCRHSVLALAIGLLAIVGPVALEAVGQGDATVYITKTGKKYHRDGCGSLSRSRIPIPLTEAVKRYGPCGNCNPPTLQTSRGGARGLTAPASSQCQATTRKGAQCSRRATRGAFCWQHAK